MNSPTADAIPPLRPPLEEIPPSIWEQHGTLVVALALLALVVVGAAVWFLTRPKKVIPPTPSTQARRALEPLRARAEEGVLLSQVSRLLRQYLTAVFALPADELTTAEFCRALDRQERVGAELSAAIAEFLRRCDARKFAPASASPALGAVEQALRLISTAEARLAELARAVHPAAPGGQ